MSSILEMVRASLGDSAVSQISKTLGEDKSKTEDAVKTALPMIVGALSRSALSRNATPPPPPYRVSMVNRLLNLSSALVSNTATASAPGWPEKQ